MPPTKHIAKSIIPINEAAYSVSYDKDFEIEIGNIEETYFEPAIKLKRWQDECYFKLKYPTTAKEIPQVDKEVNKITKIRWIEQDKEIHLYPVEKTVDLPEGFEFEIILMVKPKTNIITLNIETQGLKYYYQPPLNQEKQEDGLTCSETECKDKDGNIVIHRPENVVGSYAVYHESKQGDYEQMGGKNYRAGKAFHIYRPKIIDAEGKEVWGKLNISDGKLTVEIPQEFLDNAVYPVRHAAGLTFGYNPEAHGEASITLTSDDIVGSKYTSPANISEADTISAYARVAMFSTSIKMMLILHSNLNIVENSITSPVSITSVAQYHTSTVYETKPSVSPSTDYVLGFIPDSGWVVSLYYDTGSDGDGINDGSNDYDSPTNPTDAATTTKIWSIYCTYEAAGGLSIPVAMRHYRNMREA